jgi:hypothetical protein
MASGTTGHSSRGGGGFGWWKQWDVDTGAEDPHSCKGKEGEAGGGGGRGREGRGGARGGRGQVGSIGLSLFLSQRA